MELTKEQQDFLDECEKDFKDRYSENDKEFLETKLASPSKPPIVIPWYDNSQRSHRHQDHRDGNRGRDYRDRRGGRDWDRNRGRDGYRNQNRNWDRNRDRSGNRNPNRDWDRNRDRGNQSYGRYH